MGGGSWGTFRLWAFASASLLVALIPSAGFADTPNAPTSTGQRPLSVVGHVRTPAGAPVTSATVTDGGLFTTQTDTNGYYELQFVALGSCQITASKPGLATAGRESS